ncbi:MAG: putative lipid II flippase FtsW [Desulfovibrio sp.]|jgi:cell division protein FtsW|nr:putative lipid II flippase FtsW [Mailhella sp.]
MSTQANPLPMTDQSETKGSIDIYLLSALLIILCIGLVAVLSASGYASHRQFHYSYHFFNRQLLAMGMGAVAIFGLCVIPRSFINSIHYWAIGLSFVSLLACLLMGLTSHGAQRWIDFGIIKLQPMEFARISLVLYLSYFLGNKQNFTGDFMRGVTPPLLVTALLVTPIVLQPDLGGAILLASICVLMLLVGGSRIKHVLYIIAPIIGLIVLGVLFSPYRLNRYLAFLHPFDDMRGIGWQIVQSLFAFGSGGMFGVGVGNSIQKTGPLPEAHNDFIMAVVGEETGFIGIAFIMILFAFFFYRCYLVIMGQENRRDRLCAFGITIAIAQSFLFNLAVVLGSVPPKGVAMPFISYGGSSLLSNMICAGLILHYSRTARNT